MTEAPPDERAYMQGLYVVNSNDGWRIKRETTRALLHIITVQELLAFVFVSVPCDVQDDVPLPTVPSNPCLFSTFHQVLFPQLFQPEFFALISGKSTLLLS